MNPYLLAIDQGTTNSRAIIFAANGQLIQQYDMGLKPYYPQSGWVEQNPAEMFDNTLLCCLEVLKKANLTANQIAAVGIANQRETTIIWERETGKAIYPAIVWQDRRTSERCQQLQQTQLTEQVRKKTGLIIDPYFSATKIAWILQHVPFAMERAKKGELAFGTVECFLLWHFTQGKSHITDASNASRTLLFNIHTQTWDQDLLTAFDVPLALLPAIKDNTACFGEMDKSFLGCPIMITGMAGDQQAATIGQACFNQGMMKITYGTGCFMVLNTGACVVESHHQLLSTVIYRINNEVTYGLEGSIFCAGNIING